MWVADMDFRVPPAVTAALHRRVDHEIFGYARPVKSTIDAVVDTMARRYNWQINPAWIVWLPGLVVGLNVTAQAFAQSGEEILTLTPIYPPFITAPETVVGSRYKCHGRSPVQPVTNIRQRAAGGRSIGMRWNGQ